MIIADTNIFDVVRLSPVRSGTRRENGQVGKCGGADAEPDASRAEFGREAVNFDVCDVPLATFRPFDDRSREHVARL
ncbi:MAG: hypothetical protein AAF235_04695, partial [Planctomycetota bacterium]